MKLSQRFNHRYRESMLLRAIYVFGAIIFGRKLPEFSESRFFTRNVVFQLSDIGCFLKSTGNAAELLPLIFFNFSDSIIVLVVYFFTHKYDTLKAHNQHLCMCVYIFLRLLKLAHEWTFNQKSSLEVSSTNQRIYFPRRALTLVQAKPSIVR